MRLNESTSEIMERVRQATGAPVEVVMDDSLQALAVITASKAGIHFHVLRVNSRLDEADYVIAFQCGFLLRQAAIPSGERWQFRIAQRGLSSVKQMVTGPGGIADKFRLPAGAVSEISSTLASGLLTQLRSMPIGMRIDSWIEAEFPSLRDLQVASMKSQCGANAHSLSPQVREMTPATIWKSNVSLNSAYATFAAHMIDDRSLTLPYEASGFLDVGQSIVDLLEKVPGDPMSDRDLIDQIGIQLGISDWYEFLPVGDTK